jgi:hypothetical protein
MDRFDKDLDDIFNLRIQIESCAVQAARAQRMNFPTRTSNHHVLFIRKKRTGTEAGATQRAFFIAPDSVPVLFNACESTGAAANLRQASAIPYSSLSPIESLSRNRSVKS